MLYLASASGCVEIVTYLVEECGLALDTRNLDVRSACLYCWSLPQFDHHWLKGYTPFDVVRENGSNVLLALVALGASTVKVKTGNMLSVPLQRAVEGCWTLLRHVSLAPRCNKVRAYVSLCCRGLLRFLQALQPLETCSQ